MKRLIALVLLIVFSSYLSTHLYAASFAGQYSAVHEGEAFTLILDSSNNKNYSGQLIVDEEAQSLIGEARDGTLTGQLDMWGEKMDFTATLVGNKIQLNFPYGEVIQLNRQNASNKSSQSQITTKNTQEQVMAEAKREVFINRKGLGNDTLQTLEQRYQIPIADGRYWYDHTSGAWGLEGGPTVGFILPGLELPGPLPSDISGQGSGVFINGREIHFQDKAGLQGLFGGVYPGRYWLDSQGNLGIEGGVALTNLFVAIQSAQRQSAGSGGGSATHGYGFAYGARGTAAGGMYSGRTAGGKSVFWYPGM